MRFHYQLGAIISGAAAVIAASSPVSADGMPEPRRSAPAYEAPAPVSEPARGPCYVRADIGYGWSADEHATATISQAGFPAATGRVNSSSLESSWFGEVGLGCSLYRQSVVGGSIKDQAREVSTPTGFRGDITYGFYGDRTFKGIPVSAPRSPVGPVVPPPPVDPVHGTVKASTLMFNLYYDLPQMHGFVPYVGAGIGTAFVDLRNTVFTDGVVARPGNSDTTNLAWSLMAGVATDIGRGMVLDLGYRYLNIDGIGVNNSSLGYGLKINDLSEHQVKVGLRIPLR